MRKSNHIGLRLDDQTLHFLRQEAAERRESLSLVVRDALRSAEREKARRRREEEYQNEHRSNS